MSTERIVKKMIGRKSIVRGVAVLATLAGFVMSGCTSTQEWWNGRNTYRPKPKVEDADLVIESYAAADSLLEQAPWLRDTRAPMVTATFVDVNDLNTSSALGRIVAEQVSSRFAQQGFTMIQLTMRNNIYIRQHGGEFTLSRQVQDLSRAHNADAVVAGTYAVGRRAVFVSARLIRAADNLVLAGYDYTLPMGPDTRALAQSDEFDSFGSSYVSPAQSASRIPVSEATFYK
jgi:TolB-like protein